MALFRKKEEPAESTEEFQPQPDKAHKWFEHAKSMADRYSYDSALFYYASGLRFDPTTMSAHEAMYEAAIQYANRGGKPASSKDIRKIEDDSLVSKMAAAEFAWMTDIRNAPLGLKAIEAAIKADQQEVGYWMAERAFPLLRSYKKVNKSMLLRGRDAFAEVGAWDQAIACGELALQLDPRDAELEAELKNLAAQRAMDQGGYNEAGGKEGGFRGMIRDADKQRELAEEESIAGSSDVEQRSLARAKSLYEEDPTSPDTISKFALHLKRTGDPENIKLAHRIYTDGYNATGEYRFRMAAGDIQIDQLRKKERALSDKAKEGDADAAEQLKEARRKRLKLQSKEYAERVEKYPTDRVIKFEFGQVEFELGNIQNAMACFQAAKDEPRFKVRAGHLLGRCFAKEGWHLDAIAEFRDALAAIDATQKDYELGIRYDLMVSLLENARAERSLEDARNARDICSSIARKDITYRDIRTKRGEIEEVVKDLS